MKPALAHKVHDAPFRAPLPVTADRKGLTLFEKELSAFGILFLADG
jgi:hypothetical protein